MHPRPLAAVLQLCNKKNREKKKKRENSEILKRKVREAISAIPAEILSRVISNFDHRLSLCIAASGRKIENAVGI